MTPLQHELISRGYKRHISERYRTFHMTDTLFQKLIKDDIGKKYYIDLWYFAGWQAFGQSYPESIQAEVQFSTDGVTKECMNVTLFVKDTNKIEEVFENMWVSLRLGYNEIEG